MEKQYEIKNLDEVLDLGPNKKIISYKTRHLTTAGENYGSLMLALEITVQDEINKSEKVLSIVAKLLPPNEWLAKMFNVTVTFKKENNFYNTIVPILQQFQKEEGATNVIDFFPKCYGSRISLNKESDSVDEDAVLILENLKLNGFLTVECMVCFDLQATEVIIKDLAVFHAVPVALKIKRPDIFMKKLMPNLEINRVFDTVSEEVEQGMISGMYEVIKSTKNSEPLLERLKVALQRGSEAFKTRAAPTEPYATITHNDFWTNNTMIKLKDGKAVKNIMVDFQLIEYGSPASDIIFFLFSSVQKKVVDEHYDHIIDLYYKTFISTLEELNCDTRSFTKDLLEKEIDDHATMQFFHCMVMMRPIYSHKDKVKELSELTEDDLINPDQLTELYPIRMRECVDSFAAHNWL